MAERVHTVDITLDWALVGTLSKRDRFDASWSAIERREGQTLEQLKAIATVRSVGASTRMEGSRMSDAASFGGAGGALMNLKIRTTHGSN